ncbi:MAG: phytanoyl-CoA dioxygenase family protein [Pseudomonadota bacterium]|nr:phytanoyl-CoA dioxygenase family protein [Pseudomonadota bacterium]
MLTDQQILFYREKGYLLVEQVLLKSELESMQKIAQGWIEGSRTHTESNSLYDLDEGHSEATPKLTRVKLPHKANDYFWHVLKDSRITKVLKELLGPNTLLQTSKLNTKAPGGGAAVEWHQDWAFYPHTNDDVLALGVFLDDVNNENGPLMVIPGSHKGPVLSHLANGVFCGAVHPDDPELDLGKAVKLTGKAGDMTIHHARTLHGSAPNKSEKSRLILFYECNAADAWPLLGAGSYMHSLGQEKLWDDLQERVITGQISLEPRMEKIPVSIPMPPPVQAGSLFKIQKSGGAKSAFESDI